MADDAAGRLRAALDRYAQVDADDSRNWTDLAQAGGEVVNCLRNERILERLEAAEAVCRKARQLADSCTQDWGWDGNDEVQYDLYDEAAKDAVHDALAAWERAGGEG